MGRGKVAVMVTGAVRLRVVAMVTVAKVLKAASDAARRPGDAVAGVAVVPAHPRALDSD